MNRLIDDRRPRRRLSPRRIAALLAGVVLSSVAIDACFVEPDAVALESIGWPAKVRSPLVIAHLSDLHANGYGLREERAIAMIEAARPDVVVVTGDVVDGGTLEPARAFFEKLHAPLGVLVVRGNWEQWRPVADEAAFYGQVHATLLVNRGLEVRDDVWVAGLSDESTTAPDLGAALLGKPEGAVTVGLFHSPAYFEQASSRLDVAFAGHTHGGQIRVPGLPPLFLPRGSGRFVSGDYTVGRSRMHVSRGLGTSIVPIRFACKPEVAIVTLIPTP